MQLHLFHNFIIRRLKKDGTPVYWIKDTNEWTTDHRQATRMDDIEVERCKLPPEAQDVVTYRHPEDVVVTVERMRRAS